MKIPARFKKWFSLLDIKFPDSSEENEYTDVKIQVIKDFALYVFVALAILMIPYSVRYFRAHLVEHASIALGLLVLAIILFLSRNKLKRCNEYIALGYLLAVLGLLLSGFYVTLRLVNPKEGFYMGYVFALIQRLVGYSVINYKFMIFFHIASVALKFSLLDAPNSVALTIIVVLLEIATVWLSITGEQAQRSLFHSLFKAKKDSLKFKHLLTEFLPHEMTIFSKNYFEPLYINKAFKRTFKCDNLFNAKSCLDKLIVTKETIQKHKLLFGNLGVSILEEKENMPFSRFVNLVSKNLNIVRDLGLINITINEDPNINNNLIKNNDLHKDSKIPQISSNNSIKLAQQQQHRRHKSEYSKLKITHKKSSSPAKNKDLNVGGDLSFRSAASSDRGGSHRSINSDFTNSEEIGKKVYKAKLFMLTWDDEEEALAVMLDDVTKQKKILELKLADKNKDLVIAMVSHELRTPLNGMLGLLDIAQSKLPESQPAQSYLNACKNNGLLLLSLINSILDLSQIKNNKFKLVHSKVSIVDLMNEIKSLFEYSCVLKKLYLNIEVDPQIPKLITTDKNRLSQILINLLGNAFKFTFHGGITVKANLISINPARIQFSITDTGIGIKKDDQKKLFKLFGRLDQEDKNVNTNGVGLGLTISTSLACLLSSSDESGIRLESEQGIGSTFSFLIDCQLSQAIQRIQRETSLGNVDPNIIDEGRELGFIKKFQAYTSNNIENLAKVAMSIQNPNHFVMNTERDEEDRRLVFNSEFDEKSPRETSKNFFDKDIIKDLAIKQRASTPRLEGWGKPKRTKEKPWCLIVDDNPFNLMVAGHIMEERNYQIVTALNGKEAVDKVVAQKESGKTAFQVILLDCQMPVMDGYEATRVLRGMMKANQVEECAIIALTANNRDEDHEKLCESVGMNGVLSKPLKAEEMEDILKKLKKDLKDRIEEVDDNLIENDDDFVGSKLL